MKIKGGFYLSPSSDGLGCDAAAPRTLRREAPAHTPQNPTFFKRLIAVIYFIFPG